jgi:hypothetical protein
MKGLQLSHLIPIMANILHTKLAPMCVEPNIFILEDIQNTIDSMRLLLGIFQVRLEGGHDLLEPEKSIRLAQISIG